MHTLHINLPGREYDIKIEKGILDKNYDADLNELIFNAREIVGCREHRQIEREIAAKRIMEKIAKTQAELLQTAIEKWREEELEKIAKDPSGYIKTSDGHNCS